MNALLPGPLVRLLWMQNVARLRRTSRGLMTFKGAIYSLALLGLFALWIVPAVLAGLGGEPARADSVRDWLAPGLMLYGLLTLFNFGQESGVFFLPAEVDLLFPAPFTRRQLLVYRIAGLVQGSALLAAMFLLFLLRYVTHPLAAYLGILLALVFMILVQMALALLVSVVAEQAYSRARRGLLGAVCLVMAAGLFDALQTTRASSVAEILAQFRLSRAGAIVLIPFELLARTITAERWFPEFLEYGGLSMVMVGMLAVFVVALDANYFERSILTSQRMYERLQRVRRGGPLASGVGAQSRRIKVAPLPWLWGAGPIAWRQLTTALRSAKALLTLVPVVLVAVMVPVLFANRGQPSAYAGIGVTVMVAFTLFPQWLQFDFRVDIDRVDVLKGLPISGWAVVLGELAAPVLVASAAQLLMLALLGLLQGQLAAAWVIAAFLVPPGNLVVFGIENLFFLLFPFRPVQLGTGDLQSVGRQMLLGLVRLLVMMLAGGVSAGVGALAWLTTGKSLVAFAAGTAATLTACGAALVPLIALIYRRFDPALHVPP